MFKRQKSATVPVLLAALAGIGVARIAAGEPPATSLAVPASAALVDAPAAATATTATATTATATTATPVRTAEALTTTAPTARRDVGKLGEAALRGALDLTAMTLDGERLVAPLPDGRKAILTLHPGLQRTAEKVLAQTRAPYAAVVVMAKDGRILALAGRQGEAPAREAAPDLALTPWAPSASIFKLVTAAALVKDGVTPDEKVCFHGGLRGVEPSNLKDDRRDDRCETLGFAVSESQNAIIAKLASRHLGKEELASVARAMGYEHKPEFALPVEPSRFAVPDDALEFARMSAGFWSSELSPLAGAILTNVVASGGLRVTPRIVEAVVDGAARIELPAPRAQRALPEKIARAVGDMMEATTVTGTAAKGFRDRRGRILSVDVAGKTGSLSRNTPTYLSYSWFVGYAPADAPEVTIAVAIGNPEKWHLKAHTAARMILDTLY